MQSAALPLAVVFLTAFSLLMHEILLARLYIFFLGEIAAFMAIPVTMLGLSLGALQTHRRIHVHHNDRSIGILLIKMTAATLVAYILAFELFNHVFGLINFTEQDPFHDAARVMVYSLIFVPGIAYCGQILAICFEQNSESMNRTYASDLAGSALACLLTIPSLRIFGMSLSIALLISIMLGTTAFFFANRISSVRRYCAGGAGLFTVVLVFLSQSGLVFSERLTPDQIRSPWESSIPRNIIGTLWDDISRISLLEYGSHHKIIHNGNASNVMVEAYPIHQPYREPSFLNYYRLPFLLQQPIHSALVLFAGAGRDMVLLDALSTQPMSITGIEISPALKKMVTTPPHNIFGLDEFFAKKNIHYITGEARTSMATDRSTYDLVFVASRGAQDFSRFGHSRRYLDTIEAFDLIFDRVKAGGTVIFHYSQFERDKLEIVKRLFQKKGFEPISNSSLRVSLSQTPSATDTWIFKPTGFSQPELNAIRDFVDQNPPLKLHYAPGDSDRSQVAQEISTPIATNMNVPTDDRPYPPHRNALQILTDWLSQRSSDPDALSSFGEDQIWERIRRIAEWTRLFTLIFFVVMSGLIIAAFYLTNKSETSMRWQDSSYFLSTGIAYIIMQFCFLSRAELLLGTPILAISIVLFSFLMFNAIGSHLSRSLSRQLGIGRATKIALSLAAIAAAFGYWTITAPWVHNASLAGQSLWLIASMAPFCIFAGMLYPLGVTQLTQHGSRQLIPMSFGISTISSVLGGCLVLVLSIDFGFSAMVVLALGIYAASFLIPRSV
jgi:hypothetical protein